MARPDRASIDSQRSNVRRLRQNHFQSGLKGASSARVTSPKVLFFSQEMAVINDQSRASSLGCARSAVSPMSMLLGAASLIVIVHT